MPLTSNPLPAYVPTRALPIDVNMLFAQNQTFGTSGYLNNGASAVQVDVGPGCIDGTWVVDLQTLKVSAGNEVYQLGLLGSNDLAFGNGNVEVLAAHDWAAAAASRIFPTICGASPAVPTPGAVIRRHVMPYTNLAGEYVLRYLRAYLIVGGTSPSVKLTSWVTTEPGR